MQQGLIWPETKDIVFIRVLLSLRSHFHIAFLCEDATSFWSCRDISCLSEHQLVPMLTRICKGPSYNSSILESFAPNLFTQTFLM